MHRVLKLMLAWLIAFSAAPSAMAFAGDPLPLKEGEGAVLFHLVNNFPAASSVGYLTSPVQVQRVDADAKKLTVGVDLTGMLTTVNYIGVLPAGRYRLYDFQPRIGCWVCKHPDFPPIATMPDFEVRAGEVSYLGTIQLSIVSYPLDEKKPRKVSWGWDETPDMALGQRMFAALQPTLTAMPLRSGWAESREPGHDERWRAAIRSESQGMVIGGRYGRDGFYFGAQNGVVKRWRPGTDIEMLDTGSSFLLVSALETPGGVLLASGEASTLRSSSDGGRTWADRGATLPYGQVANLISIDDGNGVAFTVTSGGRVIVYRGQADTGDFRPFAEFEMKFAFWTGLPGVMPQLFRHGERLVLTLPSRKFAVIDLATGASEALDPPGSIGNFKMNPDGTLWCTCAKSIAFSPYVSKDFGKTWQASEISRFMMLPEFFDAERGFSYQGAIFSAKKTGVARTADGGKTWELTHEPDINLAWWAPAYSADGSVMLLHSLQVFGNHGMTLSKYSLDGGTTWQRVPDRMSWAYATGI
ncbi:MAG: exo-alpha-sialidase [Lysobacteraceae bacterium]|nr:MAG: exo-alpha-sialidase [Xanthomonadaceae bacterium]